MTVFKDLKALMRDARNLFEVYVLWFCFVLLGMGLLILQPLYVNLQRKMETLKELQLAQSHIETNIKTVEKIKFAVDSVVPTYGNFVKAMPNTVDIHEFLVDLSLRCGNVGYSMTKVELLSTKKQSEYSFYATFSGATDPVSLVDLVEKLPRLVSVTDVGIKQVKSNYEVRLNLKVYSL
jgi:Tfp pilus assembly protein PilO